MLRLGTHWLKSEVSAKCVTILSHFALGLYINWNNGQGLAISNLYTNFTVQKTITNHNGDSRLQEFHTKNARHVYPDGGDCLHRHAHRQENGNRRAMVQCKASRCDTFVAFRKC